MAEPNQPSDLTFNQYSVLVSHIAALDKKLDHLDAQLMTLLQDHEQRLRSLETRIILIVSLGVGMLGVALIIIWFLTRG